MQNMLLSQLTRGAPVVLTGLFAGAAAYITFVEHPARTECGDDVALIQWYPSYRRAAVIQPILAAGASLTGAAVAYWTKSRPYAIGSALIGAVIPFTLVFIMPTNRRLLELWIHRFDSAGYNKHEAAVLLRRWSNLHSVRTAASLIALICFVLPLVNRY
jgi:hypothetical protein